MVRKGLWAGCLVVVIAGAIYGWGAGLFWPCGPLFGASDGPQCTNILKLDDRRLEAMFLLADGTMLGATRGLGPEPDRPHTLIHFNADGEVLSDVPIPAYPKNASIGRVAASMDGNQIALGSTQEPLTVIDRSGGILQTVSFGLSAFMAFNDAGQLLLDLGANSKGIPDRDKTVMFDPAYPDALVAAPSVLHPPGFFSAGIQTVLSSDQQLFAQGLDTVRDTGIAGVRVGRLDQPNSAGFLLGTMLRPGCNYGLPRLAFSPDSTSIAAAFSCAPQWGTQSSALVIWDFVTGNTLAKIPTNKAWSVPLWIDNSTLLVERSNDRGSDLFKISIEGR